MLNARAVLRGDDGVGQVRPFELFFDLVFVFAVTQLSHRLLAHLTVVGALETLLLLLVIWSAWVTTTWFTNWFDPDRNHVRHVLVAMMLASLFMGAAIPGAFEGEGMLFAVSFTALQVGRALFGAVTLSTTLGWDDRLARTFQRTLVWHSTMGVLWITGGAVGGGAQYVLWGLAALGAYVSPLIGYYTPGLGRARTQDWPVNGLHFAERCRLFVIIALGESLLVTGATLSGVGVDLPSVSALGSAFLGTCALWWIYFDRTEEAAHRFQEEHTNPGRLARSAYTYFHLPIIAGVIGIAAFDELAMSHPGDDAGTGAAALAIGGATAFLLGHLMFERVLYEQVPVPHVVAIVLLLALTPVASLLPLLLLGGAVTVVLMGVAMWRGAVHHREQERVPV